MATFIPVQDPDDPAIADYRAVRERDLIGRGERFIAEGEVVLAVLRRQPHFAVESLLISDKRLPGFDRTAWPDGLPVFVAAQAVMDQIVGFHIHRGLLAIGRRLSTPDARELIAQLPPAALVVGLVGIANHDNMGGIFRNAAAFGADAVLLDATCCDPLYRKSIRVSVGGCFVVPYGRAIDGEDMLAALAENGFTSVALSPSGTTSLHEARPARRSAIIFGAEGPGLPVDLLDRTQTVRIAMAGAMDSLNVATSSGIVLHHYAASRLAR
ncbi:MAG: RNA methyltransferase [Chelatococcus sp.]|uniref:TrmH family RNA methyltransferase n=1 Tax=unclassified Chelatococcus TaxID=2638111 RepID=UPI001BCE5344|nr:RNA methyltransferase [Chelatococcus sp.]MBS7740138.1 RNA methyltransferase [Chelatococcus sp. HY11]CAH1653588.1 tRNA G18 (Ribose-2'-O)-methylase SpoU [Hyphomicrobiales bacterium]MBX3537105.1 RNA methyltransferase [Chelatococcus sp.]MBX3545033.1 RNA methyltransferase [Chelatococcus sp.]MCO5078562.1 RNA methyltransferase [Chelatococcus sp.]